MKPIYMLCMIPLMGIALFLSGCSAQSSGSNPNTTDHELAQLKRHKELFHEILSFGRLVPGQIEEKKKPVKKKKKQIVDADKHKDENNKVNSVVINLHGVPIDEIEYDKMIKE